jgi:hypothetical protein
VSLAVVLDVDWSVLSCARFAVRIVRLRRNGQDREPWIMIRASTAATEADTRGPTMTGIDVVPVARVHWNG